VVGIRARSFPKQGCFGAIPHQVSPDHGVYHADGNYPSFSNIPIKAYAEWHARLTTTKKWVYECMTQLGFKLGFPGRMLEIKLVWGKAICATLLLQHYT